ncbi:MAG: ABC transporter permease [Ignavibacteria bacterium]|nr:ABC transporter permease [Ignavibacteria bacterium]
MNFTSFIAKRYLRPRRLSFVGIIGIVSIFGIVLGTASLIIVMSLFNGFRGVARDLMTSFGPHIRVHAAAFSEKEAQRWNMQPVWLSKLVMRAPSGMSVVQAQSSSTSDAEARRALASSIIYGSSELGNAGTIPGIVVALGVAQNLQLGLGDTVSLVSPQQVEAGLAGASIPSGAQAIVSGVFQSNSSRDIDETYIFCTPELLSSLTGQPAAAWDIRLQNPEHARDTANIIASEYSLEGFVDTWEDMNRGVYDTMRLERIGSFIVLMLIIVVAVFNIVVSLTMGVVEKQRDIRVLKTMGLTNAMIRSIYIKQGLAIGLLSVAIGTIIGIGLCLGQQQFHWIAFDMQQGFLIPALPIDIETSDVLVVVAVGILLSASAAVYPASTAARS